MQTILRSTRIRVWSVSHLDAASSQQETFSSPKMIFQIEYLMGKDKFGTITLNTCQVKIYNKDLNCFETNLIFFY